jgi:hypothetical protein
METAGRTHASVARGDGRRWVTWLGVTLAVILCVPSLDAGLQTEDYVHRQLSQSTSQWGNLFGEGGDRVWPNYYAKDRGALPWLATENLRVNLWRPLSSLTHHIDYRFWPNHPRVMHAESILWLALVVLVVGRLYRRITTTARTASIATVLYAIDGAHAQDVGWLANRNALIATFFGALAIALHDRWRRDGWHPGALLGALSLWVGLQGGEIAVGAVAYLGAYTLTLDPAPWNRRALGLVPPVTATLLWAVEYRVRGFGAYGSGVYVDPIGQPLEFMRSLGTRAPSLLVGGLTGVPAEALFFSPRLPFAVCAATAGAMVWILVPLLRRDPVARFWALGMALSAIPASGTTPSDRLLCLVGIGGTGLVAALLETAFGTRDASARPLLLRMATFVVGSIALLMHGILSPLGLPLRSTGMASADAWADGLATSAFEGVDPERQHLVLVNVPDFYTSSLFIGVAAAKGRRVPDHVRTLYGGGEPVLVRRTNDSTLVIRAAHGFMGSPGNLFFRGPSYPMHVGQGLQLAGVQIVVTRVGRDGMPCEASFHFARSLQDPGLVWKRWDGGRFRPFDLPDVGEGVILPPAGPIRRWRRATRA